MAKYYRVVSNDWQTGELHTGLMNLFIGLVALTTAAVAGYSVKHSIIAGLSVLGAQFVLSVLRYKFLGLKDRVQKHYKDDLVSMILIFLVTSLWFFGAWKNGGNWILPAQLLAHAVITYQMGSYSFGHIKGKIDTESD